MDRRMLLALAAALVFTGLAGAVADDKKDQMDGTWRFVTQTMDGKDLPADEVKDTTVTIEGNNYTVKRGEMVLERGTFKIDKTQSPMFIERMPVEGEFKGQKILGVIEHSGENIKCCWAMKPGAERPTALSAKAGCMYEVLKRDK